MTEFYFAEDGNWGDASGLVVVDAAETDPHFIEVVDNGLSDSDRRPFAEWFKNNDHKAEPTETDWGISAGVCSFCDHWENGDLPEDGEE